MLHAMALQTSIKYQHMSSLLSISDIKVIWKHGEHNMSIENHLTDSVVRKRIRIPSSCSFCRAKKKKCDKKKPACSFCTAHNNAANCHYEGDISHSIVSYTTRTQRRSLATKSGDNDDHTSPLKGAHSLTETTSSFNGKSSPLPIVYNNAEQLSPTILEDEAIIIRRQLELLQKQIRLLESTLENKTSAQHESHKNHLSPTIDEGDHIDFFKAFCVSPRANCITVLKPLHRYHLFLSDTISQATSGHLNGVYTRMKQSIKNTRINDDYSILTNPLAAALNENFNVSKLMSIASILINRNSPKISLNIALVSSLYESKQGGLGKLGHMKEAGETNEAARVALVLEIKRILPRRTDVVFLLWQTFEKYIYPFAPFIDLPCFKRDLELIVTGLKVNWTQEEIENLHGVEVNYEINLTSFIDLAIIANFLIILRLSYLSLKINTEFVTPHSQVERSIVNINNLSYIGVEFISLAFVCLSQCKALTKVSISVLNSYMYMYFYFAHSEEHFCTFHDNERQNLVGTISGLAVNLGLYRDWSKMTIVADTVSHPGCDLFDRERMVYMTRKITHTLLEFASAEFVAIGVPMLTRIKGHFVQLPKRAKTYGNMFDGDLLVEDLIDIHYERQAQWNKIISQIEGLLYNAETAKVVEVYDAYVTIRNFLDKNFYNASTYFSNDTNFLFEVNGRISTAYHCTLNKILQFQQYLMAQQLIAKLNVKLLFHYQDKDELSNYFYFLKQMFITIATSVKMLVDQYTLNNQQFLQVDQDVNLKNFNLKINPTAGRIITDLFFIFHSFIFQCFLSLFWLINQQRNAGVDIDKEALDEKIWCFKVLKKLFLKLYEVFLKCHLYKNGIFYVQYIKWSHIASLVFSEFHRLDAANDNGEDMVLLNLNFTSKKPKVAPMHKILDLEYELKDIPDRCMFMNLSNYQLKQLVSILGFDQVKVDSQGNVINEYLDSLLEIVRTNVLYDTFLDPFSYSENTTKFAKTWKEVNTTPVSI